MPAFGEGGRPRRTAQEGPETITLFLAELSHEIRNPLNVVLGLCHLATRTPPLSPQQRSYLAQIQTAAHTLLRLVNDNLDLSKIEAGALTVARQPVDLGALSQDLVQLVRRRADEKGLFFHIQWGPGVPRHLLGDADRLKQVLLNLVDNALKFTPQGEVRLLIDHVPAGLAFQVQDTGPGLDAEQRASLFTPFARPVPHRDGSGLGLALSRRLVHLMGGEMEVDSWPGQGCTFRFTLPAPRAEGPEAPFPACLVVECDPGLGSAFADGLRPFVKSVSVVPTLAAAEARITAEGMSGLAFLPHGAPRVQRRHGLPPRTLIYRVPARSARRAQKAVELGWVHDFLLVPTDSARILDLLQEAAPTTEEPVTIRFHDHPRILLVEDSQVNRMVTRELLERAGLLVTEAADGQTALRAALAPGDPPACILMDLELPDMDGLEATRRIRALRGSHVPILALTAHLIQDERHLCAMAGMDDFLAKPVEPEVLYRTLERHLPGACRLQPPRPSHPATPPSIRWKYLQDRLQGNTDLLRRVLSQFRREAASFRLSLREAMLRGDMAGLTSLAHTLAGAAANIGADPVAMASRRLHRAPSSGNLAILEQALERLESELAAAAFLAPPRDPAPATPVDLPGIRVLLERNSLDALAHLPRLRQAFLSTGRSSALGDLEEALECLDFPRALALLDTLPDPGRPACSGGPQS